MKAACVQPGFSLLSTYKACGKYLDRTSETEISVYKADSG